MARLYDVRTSTVKAHLFHILYAGLQVCIFMFSIRSMYV